MQDLKTGMSENSVFAVFHPDASELFTVCSSLEKVCTMNTTAVVEPLIMNTPNKRHY